jgi:hypothetical protein
VAPVTFVSNWALFRASDPLDTATPIPKHTAAMSTVTSGPAAAIRNSTPGESASLPSFATPPNIHRSMPSIGIPLRMATQACPSSCNRIERKNSSALITASTKAFEPGATSS